MTETQLRNHYVDTLRGWIGAKEGDELHKRIIRTYNSLPPLPQGYRMTYTAPWCAATVSAAAIEAGLTDIIFRECSCARMIELFRKNGRWMEDDSYIPQIGDILFYDWNDSGKGDCTGTPKHVGVVEKVVDGVITVIEGNYHDAVDRRKIPVNGKYIRGYGLPDYASMAFTGKGPEIANPGHDLSDCASVADSPTPATLAPTSDVTPPPVAPQTNADRLRAMTNDELFDFLSNPPSLAVGQSWKDWLDAVPV